MTELTAQLLLQAYTAGYFPMAESKESRELYWFDPRQRGILPLERFHVPRRLRRTLRQGRFVVTWDEDFHGVIEGCAEATTERPDTWINTDIIRLYSELHAMGFAHSVEARCDGALVGGLYGVALGGAFFGESMFSRVTDASKVALVHLVARLKGAGFSLLDTQFITEHLTQFGACEISRSEYRRRLSHALALRPDLLKVDAREAVAELLAGLSRPPAPEAV